MSIQTNLQSVSTDLAVELRLWHEQSLNALKQLAEVAARSDMAPSTELQQSTELMQRTFPAFHQLFVTNEAGVAIASYPAIYKTITDGTNLKALSLTKQLITSDIWIEADETSSPPLVS